MKGQPLAGLTILVSRPPGQESGLAQQLQALGANVLRQPVIEIAEPASWASVDSAIGRIRDFDWIVFTSANGVRRLLERLTTLGGNPIMLARSRYAAIGPATAAAMRDYHLHAHLVPQEHRSEGLATALKGEVAGQCVLLVRAEQGREVLRDQLELIAGELHQAVVYRQHPVASWSPEVVSALDAGQVDWITLTSSNIVREFAARLTRTAISHIEAGRSRIATISPVTSAAVRECGWDVSAEARPYSTEGLVAALVAASQ